MERRCQEMADNLERRENYLQTKEKKWVEIENYLQTLYDDNEELFYKMQDLKLTVDVRVKMTNVVTENCKLRRYKEVAKKRLRRMRRTLLDPYFLR